MSIGFSQFYSLCYKKGLRISMAGCGMRKTEQDIGAEEYTWTRGYSSLVKIYISRIFLGSVPL